MEQETKDNLTKRSTWIRLAYMTLFAVIFYIVTLVIALVAVVQFLSRLFTGNVNQQLQSLGQGIAAYVNEITVFLTYHTDDKPYPFGPPPKGSPGTRKAARARPQRTSKAKAARGSGHTAKKP